MAASTLDLAVGNSNFISSATGLDEGPVSRVHEIKTPKVERVLLRQYHHVKEFVTGTLCLTDRHLIFVEPTGAQETWVLFHHISVVERQPLTTRGYPLILSCKTFQQLYFIIPRESDFLDIVETIHLFAQPKLYSELYAFQYKPNSSTVKRSSGWLVFDAPVEYERMGVPNSLWQATSLNFTYELCATYSRHLYVPASADVATIQGSAKFRSKGRLPILAYYYAPRESALCRSSQPLAGLLGRSPEDEQMIQCILRASPNSQTLHVMDTRPRINAMANRAAGKGYEAAGYYPNTNYQFYNIQNIHVMRESLQRLIEGVHTPNQSVAAFLSCLESSSWFRHIQLIMEASLFSSRALQSGSSVLVHCSDGWDRTAQTCALTSLFLDPYYRSLHGFMILVEKEWLSCGHKFSHRCGHVAVEDRESSPIFTQFLECVWQVLHQMPTAFQFNEHFLLTLHDHAHSCQFGTFIGNCEKERAEQRFSELTFSLWGHIWDHIDDYINPLYCHDDHDVIEPSTDMRHLKFWRGLYGRYCQQEQVVEKEDEMMASLRQQNACFEENIQFLTQAVNALQSGMDSMEEERPGREHTVSSATRADSGTGMSRSGREAQTSTRCQISDDPGTCLTDTDADTGDATSTTANTASTHTNTTLTTATDANTASTHTNTTLTTATDANTASTHTNTTLTTATDANTASADQTDANRRPEGSSPSPPPFPRSARHLSPASASTAEFSRYLDHLPEMNLPWQPLRTVTRCSCGRAFSYLVSKYHCCHCGCVSCDVCASSHSPLPWQASQRPHRVCRSCHKLMKRRQEMGNSHSSITTSKH